MSEEISYREGETVTVQARQFDQEGKCMSEMNIEWYGMDNPMANAMSLTLVEGVTKVVSSWDEAKHQGRSIRGD